MMPELRLHPQRRESARHHTRRLKNDVRLVTAPCNQPEARRRPVTLGVIYIVSHFFFHILYYR